MDELAELTDRKRASFGQSDAFNTLVHWAGLIGPAQTLFGFVTTPATCARLLAPPLQSWMDGLKTFWSKILFVVPKVGMMDAAILTFAAFVVMNSLNAARHPRRRSLGLTVSLIPLSLIFAAIYLVKTLLVPLGDTLGRLAAAAGHAPLPKSDEATSYILPMLQRALCSQSQRFCDDLWAFMDKDTSGLGIGLLVASVAILPFLLAAPVLPLAHRLAGRPFNLASLVVRLWQVLLTFAALLALNAALLWVGL